MLQLQAYVCAVVISTAEALPSCSRIHCLMQSDRCGADLVSLYCIWRWPPPWPHLFILVTLAEVSEHGGPVGDHNFHTQGDQASHQSVVSRVSDLPLP